MLTLLGVAVCVSVLVEAVTTAYRYRSTQRLGGFLAHAVLSAAILTVGLTVVVVPQFWHWVVDRIVDAYLFCRWRRPLVSYGASYGRAGKRFRAIAAGSGIPIVV